MATKNLTITHAFLKAQIPGKTGTHTVGCIALAATPDPTKIRVAYWVAPKSEKVVRRLAHLKAVARLASKHADLVERDITQIISVSGVERVLNRIRQGESFVVEKQVSGALGDLAQTAEEIPLEQIVKSIRQSLAK